MPSKFDDKVDDMEERLRILEIKVGQLMTMVKIGGAVSMAMLTVVLGAVVNILMK